MERIEKLEEAIRDYIGPNKTIIDTKIVNLMAPGENYMSEIVKIDLVLSNKDNGVKEDVHLVAKLVTEGPIMGNTANMNESEFLFYNKILPAIGRFHENHGLEPPSFYPKFVGGRINLTGNDVADEDGIIVLENLIHQGYQTLDRHVGFDLETAKLVLRDLATFHAAPLAMKLLEPETFETEIKPNCAKPPPFDGPPSGPPGGLPGDGAPKGPPPMLQVYDIIAEIFEQDERYSDLVENIKKYKEKMKDAMKSGPAAFFNKKPREPFATLTHSDMWINNTMQLLEDGRAIQNKFVDFQMSRIGSLAGDLIFILFSSVELSCLKENLDLLLRYYHEHFASILQKCGCYDNRFSFERFLDELKSNADDGIGQSSFMISMVIFAKKGHAVDVANMHQLKKEDVPPIAIEKLTFLFVEACKRGWV